MPLLCKGRQFFQTGAFPLLYLKRSVMEAAHNGKTLLCFPLRVVPNEKVGVCVEGVGERGWGQSFRVRSISMELYSWVSQYFLNFGKKHFLQHICHTFYAYSSIYVFQRIPALLFIYMQISAFLFGFQTYSGISIFQHFYWFSYRFQHLILDLFSYSYHHLACLHTVFIIFAVCHIESTIYARMLVFIQFPSILLVFAQLPSVLHVFIQMPPFSLFSNRFQQNIWYLHPSCQHQQLWLSLRYQYQKLRDPVLEKRRT